MIEPIPGWGWEIREAGIFLIPPAGERAGSIRYAERLRPLRRMVDIVASLPVPAGYVAKEMSGPEALVTAEGEYAAIMTCPGVLDGAPVERTIGCVFVDDFYSLVGGVAWQPELGPVMREKVRQLVVCDRHLLGVRRRRFVHRKPPGWHGLLVPPYHAYWFAHDYRRNGGLMSVFPAVPEPAELVTTRLLLGANVPADYDLAGGVAVNARAGLSGTLHQTSDLRTATSVAVLQDDRYAYPLLLSTSPARQEQHRALFLELVGSVEPIPRAGQNLPPGAATVLDMWDE
jgi:hypothetical protein